MYPPCSFNTLTYANLVSHISSLTFLFLDYFEAIPSHHITSPINISICISKMHKWNAFKGYFNIATIPLSHLNKN